MGGVYCWLEELFGHGRQRVIVVIFFSWLVYMISPPLCLVPQTAFHAMESATVLVLGFLPACDWVQNYYVAQLILP